MTLLDIRHQLFRHFLDNDVFVLSTDLAGVKVSDNQVKLKESLVETTLREMCREGICAAIEDKEGIVRAYNLLEPVVQHVTLSGFTVNRIAKVVSDLTGGEIYLTDVSEDDIVFLCDVCADMLDEAETEE